MSVEVPDERKHILTYFESLKQYRSELHRISEKYVNDSLATIDKQISDKEDKLKEVQKELKKLSNRQFYSPLITLLVEFDQRCEAVFPVYQTVIGKSIVFLLSAILLFHIPIVLAIYASVAVTLYFKDTSNKPKKTGYKYFIGQEKRIRRDIENHQVKKDGFIQETNHKRREFASQSQRWKTELYVMEKSVNDIFDRDTREVVSAGLDVLNIRNPEDDQEGIFAGEELEKEPILMFDGIKSKKDSKSSIVYVPGYQEETKGDILISDKYFYSFETTRDHFTTANKQKKRLKGIDGKYKYSVYEFVIIYLSSNFLSYYRCYWDFLRGSFVDKEIAEYLFDSIVSVKTRERSSLNINKEDERRKYSDSLILTTMDSRTVVFKLSDDKKEFISPGQLKDSHISEIYDAAERIRYWLRQRRVDLMRVETIGDPGE